MTTTGKMAFQPTRFAEFCGGKVVFGADTVWHDPVISSADEFDRLHFNPENRYWKALLESIDYGESLKPQGDLDDPESNTGRHGARRSACRTGSTA